MVEEIFWIHEKILNTAFLKGIMSKEKPLFIWDNKYFQKRNYSLKRLVFIYETVCEMQVEIIKGDTVDVLKQLMPQKIKTIFTNDTQIKELMQYIAQELDLEVIALPNFVNISDSYEFKRFFKYWHKAKNLAFLKNGGNDQGYS